MIHPPIFYFTNFKSYSFYWYLSELGFLLLIFLFLFKIRYASFLPIKEAPILQLIPALIFALKGVKLPEAKEPCDDTEPVREISGK